MRTIATVALLACVACSSTPHEGTQQQAVTCTGTDVAIYTPRFTAQYGASGVATPADAANGMTSSDPNATVPPPDPSNTAMIQTCGPAPCGPGQVAVANPPTAGGGGPGVGGPTGGPTPGGGGLPTDVGPGPSTPPPTMAATLVCTSPPPECPPGESPQFTEKGTWECTDCALVVSYGGTYGNHRRCVSVPDLMCPDGQVPTWVFEDDQWECKDKCDNGQYDQHVINGEMVCVPC